MTISMVASATSTECRDADPSAILAAIREGKWREPVERIRAQYQVAITEGRDPKEAVAALKRKLPGILWSGRFSRRAKDGLIAHSGLLCADLDDVPSARIATLRQELSEDPHVAAVFLSPTGTGLKVVFAVTPDASLHDASFRAVQMYLKERYAVTADEAAKDVSRLCFASFDPQVGGYPMPRILVPAGPPASRLLESPPTPPTSGKSSDQLPASASALLATGAPKGQRNERALWLACQLRDSGMDQGSAESQIRTFASHCTPPLPESEAIQAVRSAYKRSPRQPAKHAARARTTIAAEYLAGDDETQDPVTFPEPNPWPAPMHPAALHGLAGDLVRIIEPNSEADPAALLIMLLAAFGNAAGSGAHFMAEARAHGMRIWPILVGETAKGRKGSAWSSLRHVLNQVDASWTSDRIQSGLSSGEGLIWAVRDPITKEKKGEVVVEDGGVSDKRLFAIEEEFSAVLKVAERNGNTITDVLRRAWDHGDLRTLTKNSPTRATGAHVTVVGHITLGELIRLLSETDAINGFGNRFVWLAVRRSKQLPDGGQLHRVDLAPLVLQIRRALDFARTSTSIDRTPGASNLWHAIYPILTADRPGLLGALTNRAEAYVLRLALVYAMLDRSPIIDIPHIQAALAVWDFCERSAEFIFGDSLGDRVIDRLRDELRWAGSRGLTQTAIRDLFNRNEPSYRLVKALSALERAGLARKVRDTARPGRPAITWYTTDDQNAEMLPDRKLPTRRRPLRSFLT